MRLLRVLVGLTLGLALTTSAFGQEPKPIGPAAVDVRVAVPRFKGLPSVANTLGVDAKGMPGRGLGLVFGAHWYPARIGVITFGLGGEVMMSAGTRRVGPIQQGGPEGPAVKTTLSSISPQISFNFGKREGWSYISGGIGWAGFESEREDQPLADSTQHPRAINYGAGARWFARKHVALSLDLRFYAVSQQEPTARRPAVPHATMLVFSGGVGFK